MALQAGNPVVLLKTGRTTQGAHIAMRNTASMFLDDDVLMAAARQAGVVAVDDLETLFDTLKVMAAYPLHDRDPGISIVSLSGAALVMAGDPCFKRGLEITPEKRTGTCVPGRALYDIGSWSGELKIFEPINVFRELKAEYPDKVLLIVIAGHRNMAASWGDELEKNGLIAFYLIVHHWASLFEQVIPDRQQNC